MAPCRHDQGPLHTNSALLSSESRCSAESSSESAHAWTASASLSDSGPMVGEGVDCLGDAVLCKDSWHDVNRTHAPAWRSKVGRCSAGAVLDTAKGGSGQCELCCGCKHRALHAMQG